VRRKLQKLLGTFVILSATSLAAQAGGVIYKYTSNGQWVQAYSRTASIYLTIDGDGVNRVVNLQAHSGSYYAGDSKTWIGEIPADAVTVQGLHQVSISVDTCNYTAKFSTGCGVVELTATSEPGWENFLTYTQASHTDYWDGLMYQYVGHIKDVFTSTTGTVMGYPISIDNSGDYKTWMSRMGTAVDLQILVSGAP